MATSILSGPCSLLKGPLNFEVMRRETCQAHFPLAGAGNLHVRHVKNQVFSDSEASFIYILTSPFGLIFHNALLSQYIKRNLSSKRLDRKAL